MKKFDYDKQIEDDRRWYEGLLNDIRLVIALPVILIVIIIFIVEGARV